MQDPLIYRDGGPGNIRVIEIPDLKEFARLVRIKEDVNLKAIALKDWQRLMPRWRDAVKAFQAAELELHFAQEALSRASVHSSNAAFNKALFSLLKES
jgi:hypothetical protein